MVGDADWVSEQMERIEQKRAVLKTLKEALEQWETEIDWEKVPPEKQAALMALAEESVETLKDMIANLVEQIRDGLAGREESSGTDGADD